MTETAAASTPKAPARKAPAKKAPARKAVAKKVVAKKLPVKKAVPVKAAAAPLAAKPDRVKPVKAIKPKKPAKDKVIRDSFTMPASDFAIIDRIKQRAIEWKQPVKKSEVLRAALHALGAMPDVKVKKLLAGLSPVKKGRPNKPD